MEILQKTQIKEAASLLTSAFYDNPMFLYLFPNESKRQKALKPIFAGIIEFNLAKGTIYISSNRLEGMLALVKENKHQTKKQKLPVYIKSFMHGLKSLPHVSIFDVMKRYRKTKNTFEGHKYLFRKIDSYYSIQMVAVHPKCRGKGYMSELMRNVLAYVDSQNSICLLETETLTNVKMYRHFGFQVIGKMTYVPGEWEQYYLIYDPLGIVLPHAISKYDEEMFKGG
ncbi:MAG: GNAT family N-acetyltransferase [Turicibacter sp.]